MSRTIGTMPRKPKPPTATVRLYKELARGVRTVAADRGQDVADYLDAILRPIMDKELAKLSKILSQRGRRSGP
jgi:hypothetical protein